jgi:hypothetical protein
MRGFPDSAIRFFKAFGRSPELQLQYDLWQAEQRSGTIKVRHFPAPALCRTLGGPAAARPSLDSAGAKASGHAGY